VFAFFQNFVTLNGKGHSKLPTQIDSVAVKQASLKVGSLNDEDLVELCKRELPHRTVAFQEILKRYEGMVYSTCYRMLGSPQEAEEACQDTFLRIFHKLYQFEGRSTFKTWLFRIVYNFCMTRRRKLATKRERDNTIGDEIVHGVNVTHQLALGPDQDHSEYVHLALNEMNESDKEILTLRFISDLTLEQMSEILDLKLSATKMRLYRSMEKFRDVYEKLERARTSRHHD